MLGKEPPLRPRSGLRRHPDGSRLRGLPGRASYERLVISLWGRKRKHRARAHPSCFQKTAGDRLPLRKSRQVHPILQSRQRGFVHLRQGGGSQQTGSDDAAILIDGHLDQHDTLREKTAALFDPRIRRQEPLWQLDTIARWTLEKVESRRRGSFRYSGTKLAKQDSGVFTGGIVPRQIPDHSTQKPDGIYQVPGRGLRLGRGKRILRRNRQILRQNRPAKRQKEGADP